MLSTAMGGACTALSVVCMAPWCVVALAIEILLEVVVFSCCQPVCLSVCHKQCR
jgi:hypothetical protein